MTPPIRPTKHQRDLQAHLGLVAAFACLLSGCHATPTPAAADESTVKLVTTASLINEGGPVFGKPLDGGSLINEGGPVFGKPNGPAQFQIDGLIMSPHYFTGALTALSVTAERLNGVSYPDVAASKVQSDGGFTLKGPATDKYFFASASFNFEDTSHTVRALAKAGETSRLTIDTASTLVASKIAMAEQKRHLYSIDYQDTQDLTNQVRQKLGNQLDAVRLDAANDELSSALNLLILRDEALHQRIVRWEFTLNPSLGRTPDPMLAPAASASAAVSPSATPSLTPSPGAPPVK
jgi:hypothetical protein